MSSNRPPDRVRLETVADNTFEVVCSDTESIPIPTVILIQQLLAGDR